GRDRITLSGRIRRYRRRGYVVIPAFRRCPFRIHGCQRGRYRRRRHLNRPRFVLSATVEHQALLDVAAALTLKRVALEPGHRHGVVSNDMHHDHLGSTQQTTHDTNSHQNTNAPAHPMGHRMASTLTASRILMERTEPSNIRGLPPPPL